MFGHHHMGRTTILLVLGSATSVLGQTTYYVDSAAQGPETGTAGSPFQSIGAALHAALSGDEIVVAPGLYSGPANRDLDFAGRSIHLRSTDPADPAVVNATIIDGQDLSRLFSFTGGETFEAVVEGFTLRGGHAPGPVTTSTGGGMLIVNSSPTIRHCYFDNCEAGFGGGIYIENGAPALSRCQFYDCDANAGSGAGGGAYIADDPEATLSLTHCTFIYNDGSGMRSGVNLILDNCMFHTNEGGGLRLDAAGTTAHLHHCTVSLNEGAAIIANQTAELTLTNSIVWNNEAPHQIVLRGSQMAVEHTCVSGGQAGIQLVDGAGQPSSIDWGAGNLDDDPFYVYTIAPPYSMRLLSTSPCIDAGTNASLTVETDLDGKARVSGGVVDMGGYEFICTPGIYGDLNTDQRIDLLDIFCALDGFSGNSSCAIIDIAPCGGDGAVDLLDILAILDSFRGEAPCSNTECPQ